MLLPPLAFYLVKIMPLEDIISGVLVGCCGTSSRWCNQLLLFISVIDCGWVPIKWTAMSYMVLSFLMACPNTGQMLKLHSGKWRVFRHIPN